MGFLINIPPSSSPTGSAGGDLSGTYPNPTVAKVNGTAAASVTIQGNTFNGASQLVQLNGSSQLPAVSGALLTNLPASGAVTLLSHNVYNTNQSAPVSFTINTTSTYFFVYDLNDTSNTTNNNFLATVNSDTGANYTQYATWVRNDSQATVNSILTGRGGFELRGLLGLSALGQCAGSFFMKPAQTNPHSYLNVAWGFSGIFDGITAGISFISGGWGYSGSSVASSIQFGGSGTKTWQGTVDIYKVAIA